MRPPAKCLAPRYAFWMCNDAEDFEEAGEVAEEMLLTGTERIEDKSVLVDADVKDSSLGVTVVSTDSSGRVGNGGLWSSA